MSIPRVSCSDFDWEHRKLEKEQADHRVEYMFCQKVERKCDIVRLQVLGNEHRHPFNGLDLPSFEDSGKPKWYFIAGGSQLVTQSKQVHITTFAILLLHRCYHPANGPLWRSTSVRSEIRPQIHVKRSDGLLSFRLLQDRISVFTFPLKFL